MSTTERIGIDRRLYIMRHAKSSWKDMGLADFARPLNGRGRRDAPRVGRLIAEEHGLPDLVLCSSARRTVETYCRATVDWPGWPDLRTDGSFYACAPQVWLDAIAALPRSRRTVMILGHMPEIFEVLAALVGVDRAPDRFPTGALAVVACSGGWSTLAPDTCRLLSFQVPRDL